MIKEKIVKFVFAHPLILDISKNILSNKYIVNSNLYKKLVLKKAQILDTSNIKFQTIFIETTLTCNSRCVFCYHHNKVLTGTMTMDLFKKIIDDSYENGVRNVILSVYGEPLVDKYFFERIKYLTKKGMTYGFISNGSLLTREKTNELLSLPGLNFINFSVNGYNTKIYEKMMIGLKRNVSYKNILYFLKMKEKLKPEIIVNISTVKNKINEKDFSSFFKYWSKQKGVHQVMPIELRRLMGDEEYNGDLGSLGPMNQKSNWLSPCKQIWSSIVVYYDGKVTVCCDDLDLRRLIVGDFTKQSFKQIVSSNELKKLKKYTYVTKEKIIQFAVSAIVTVSGSVNSLYFFKNINNNHLDSKIFTNNF